MITSTKVHCKPANMNLEDDGKFPCGKGQVLTNLKCFKCLLCKWSFYWAWFVATTYRACQKIEKIFDHFTLHDDLKKMAVGGIQG